MTRITLNILAFCTALPASVVVSFCFIALGYAMDVTLQWDANTEPDLDGYRVYYDTNSGHPYNGTEADEGNSGKIEVDKNITTITLHGLPNGQDYYFVVTAYDTEDLESGYSNEVTTSPEPSAPESATGAGGGDGGGCFIATAAFG